MRNIFIVNPAAGTGKIAEPLIKEIKAAAEKTGAVFEVYKTAAPGDGERLVRDLCGRREGKLRFFACGGDGTLNEVVNGAVGCERAQIGCIPSGTGNDFIRNFPDTGNFRDVEAQLRGQALPIDLIKYRELSDSASDFRYCINMFNIGFDCNVVDLTAKLKKCPFIAGSFAYLLGVGIILLKKKGADLKIRITGKDGSEKQVQDGALLLVAIANGSFCGGGVKGAPKAAVDDGLIDVSIIKNVSRRIFIAMFGKYAKGTHLDAVAAKEIICYRKCRGLTVEARRGMMRLCTDGEITDAVKVYFETVPGAIRFSLPERREEG